MSLQVWLPLNGNLTNQGLNNITVINNGATVNNSGKIGKCYSFNGSSNYLSFNPIFSNNNQTFSFSCWIKLNSIPSTYYCLLCSRTNTASTGVAIYLKSDKTFVIDIGTRWITSVQTINANEWYHITVVSSDQGRVLYINGAQADITTSVKTKPITVNTNCTFIGAQHSSAVGTVDGTYLNGFINDVRIYNHALSKKEVEEISKGLVLHYKLDAQNLINKNTLVTGKYLKGSDGTSVTHASWCYTDYIPITPEKIYLGVGLSSSGTVPGIVLYNINKTKTRSIALTANQNIAFTADTNEYYVRLSIRQETNLETARFYETPTIIYDCSGYGNNGTAVNTAIINNTKKYEISTSFSGSSSYIKVTNNNWCSQGMPEITINLWAKTATTSWTPKIFSCTESGGFNTEAGNSGYWRFPIHVYTNAAQTTTAYKYDSKEIQISDLSTTDWVMFTFVYDSTGTKTYLNGQLHHTYTNTSYGIHFNMNARLFLGCEANTANPTSPYFNGYESDFRIYATALSAAAIKELYDTSASIDASGNVYARELKEV